MRAVHVLFYAPVADDVLLNHIVTAFDPPYSHCDIQFEDGFASSVYQFEDVYWEKKNFSRLNYARISLALEEAEYARVRSFCVQSHNEHHAFDLWGMLLSKMPIAIRRPSRRTFCSRYVLEALQQSGRPEFAAHDPVLASPSSLHALLSGTGKSFLHVSEKRLAAIR